MLHVCRRSATWRNRLVSKRGEKASRKAFAAALASATLGWVRDGRTADGSRLGQWFRFRRVRFRRVRLRRVRPRRHNPDDNLAVEQEAGRPVGGRRRSRTQEQSVRGPRNVDLGDARHRSRQRRRDHRPGQALQDPHVADQEQRRTTMWSQFSKTLVTDLHEAGLKSAPGSSFTGYALDRSQPRRNAVKDGADCLVIDAEARTGQVPAASMYMARLRKLIGTASRWARGFPTSTTT